jgi:hypothetical protein
VGGRVVRAIQGALLDYLRDQEIRDGPQPRAEKEQVEQVVGGDELAPGDARWFRGAP